MGLGLKRIPFLLLAALAIGSAGCPALSPVGGPSNPAGITSSEKSGGSSSTDDTVIDTGDRSGNSSVTDGSGTPPPPAPPTGGSSIYVAQGGTFNPKGDNEGVETKGMKGAKDWRLLFVFGNGVNDWWELHKAPPELYPIFKDSTTADFRMRLEALMPDCGCWQLGSRAVHMVYQPKGQPPSAAQSLDAMPNLFHLLLEGYTLAFPSLPLGEGTVTFSVENEGGPIPLGSLTTYFPSEDSMAVPQSPLDSSMAPQNY